MHTFVDPYARAEEQKWHADLAVAKVVERTGASFDTVIDYTPLPLLWECGGFRFVALQTGIALRAEGAAMHHCVASYWQNVVNGTSRIYSILENGNRVATLDLGNRLINYRWGTNRYQVRQSGGDMQLAPGT